MQQFEKNKIISLKISNINYQKALDTITQLAEKRKATYACFANAHMTIEARQKKEFAELVNLANFVFADGQPIVFALRCIYGLKQDRIAGMDFMEDVLKESNEKKLSIFLYGSTANILEEIIKKIQKDFPDIKIAGHIAPPFRKISSTEQETYIQIINQSKANIVLVALGCPKQEIWMAENSKQINAVLLGVGGAFPVFAEKQKRAPKWMQSLAIEWIFRLCQEPKRLWRRYLITNSLFIFYFVRQLLIHKTK